MAINKLSWNAFLEGIQRTHEHLAEPSTQPDDVLVPFREMPQIIEAIARNKSERSAIEAESAEGERTFREFRRVIKEQLNQNEREARKLESQLYESFRATGIEGYELRKVDPGPPGETYHQPLAPKAPSQSDDQDA